MNQHQYFVKINADQPLLWRNKHPLLTWLDIEITERCNNNCIHCYINLPPNDVTAIKRELSSEAIKKILQEAASLGCLTVRFTGGEPLLREDFEEIYLFARELGLKVLLFTNATLLTPRIADLFTRIPPREKIEVTLFGIRKSSYEAITRNPGSFAAAWMGISLLLGQNIPFVVKSVLLPPNRNEREEFEAWAARLPWMDHPPPYAIFFDLHGRRDERKNSLIRSLRPSAEEGIKRLTREEDRYLRGMQQFCSKFMFPIGDKPFICAAGKSRGCVDAYGYFQLCMLLRAPNAIYDLKEGCLREAVEDFFPKVRETKSTNPDYLARCAHCFLGGFCEQCPGKSWMENGTLDTPVTYLCEVAHIRARNLGLLRKDEVGWKVKDWRERIAAFSSQERLLPRRRGEDFEMFGK